MNPTKANAALTPMNLAFLASLIKCRLVIF
jgi:hypothetical protein